LQQKRNNEQDRQCSTHNAAFNNHCCNRNATMNKTGNVVRITQHPITTVATETQQRVLYFSVICHCQLYKLYKHWVLHNTLRANLWRWYFWLICRTAQLDWLTYLLTYLLTHSMEQSPSWEANWFVASQEIPRTLWNPKVHHQIHKCPPSVPILSQLLPVSTHSYFLILSSHLRLGLPNGLFPSGFPTRTLCTPLPSPIRATCPPISFFSILPPTQYWVGSKDP